MMSRSAVRFAFALLSLGFTTSVFAESTENFWRNAIKSCNAAAYDSSALFLGTTNTIGPGSVWNLKRKDSPVNDALGEAYFGSDANLQKHVNGNAPGQCTSTANPSWSVTGDAPVSVTGIGSGEVKAAIQSAKSISVTISQAWEQSVPSFDFLDAIDSLNRNSVYFKQAVTGHENVLLSAIAVEGLAITYHLQSALSVEAQAQIAANPKVQVGSAGTPVTAQVQVQNAGTQVKITVPGKTYVLGKFAKINKLTEKEIKNPSSQVTLFVPNKWGS